MRRRLDLAASLVGRPSVIFLDEPTTGLDPAKREDMWDVVRSLVTDGSTVLLTTQYLDEADALADEITVIDHGRVIAHDTPDGLKRVVGGQTPRPSGRPTRPALDEVAAILGRRSPAAAPNRLGRGALSVAGRRTTPRWPRRSTGSRAAGIAVTELSLHLPSLDEVFFTLTGTPAGDDRVRDARQGCGMTATLTSREPDCRRARAGAAGHDPTGFRRCSGTRSRWPSAA